MKIKLAILALFCILVNSGVFAQNWSLSGNTLNGTEFIGSINNHGFSLVTSGKPRIVIKPDGNVGIGTTSTSGFRLSVEGKLRAREVFIDLDQWADHVFDPGHHLLSLNELESFIDCFGHLPSIPTEAEVLTQDVSIGVIQTLMLEKIEEITLYLIDLNKRLESLESGVFNSADTHHEK